MMRVDIALFAAALNLLGSLLVFVTYAATHLTAGSSLALDIWVWVNIAAALHVMAWDRNVKRGAR